MGSTMRLWPLNGFVYKVKLDGNLDDKGDLGFRRSPLRLLPFGTCSLQPGITRHPCPAFRREGNAPGITLGAQFHNHQPVAVALNTHSLRPTLIGRRLERAAFNALKSVERII